MDTIDATGPSTQPGPGGYGTIPPDPPQPAAGEPEPLQGTVALRQRAIAATAGMQRPKAEPIDGALLWALVRRYLTYYMSFHKPSDADLVTAWVFHAAARNRSDTGKGPLIWQASPRLLIISRKRGSGKSTLLRLCAFLTGSHGKAPRITAARFAQITAQAQETVYVDEGRLVLGAGDARADLQACLIDGYTPGSFWEVSKTSLHLFGSAALATKESLITEATKAVDGDESSLGDLFERCLKVLLTEPDFPPRPVGEQAEADGALLCRALVAWTNARRDDLKQAAKDIAEEDYQADLARARRGEKKKKKLRTDQIACPLRAIGRVLGPGAEEDILGALAGADEGAEIMAELQERPWASDDADDEDEPGNDPLTRFAPAPPEPGTAPWTARYEITTAPGADPQVHEFADPYTDPWAARRACDALHEQALTEGGFTDGGPLNWQPNSQTGTWGATFQPPGEQYPEIRYTVTMTGEEN